MISSPAERYATMKYPHSGRSGLRFPVLSLGGWHNFEVYEKAKELTLYAFNHGVTHIDLANNYGPPPGAAEQSFGRLMREELAAHRDDLIISTKAGYHMWPGPYGEWGSRKYLLASLDQSLKRLGLDYVDIFYSHRFDPQTPLEETMGALAHAVRSGKALYAAISNYPVAKVLEAAALAREMGAPLVIHQCIYSMLKRQLEEGVLAETAEAGMGMIIFSPLAQGLLTDRYLKGIPDDSRAAIPSGFLKREQVADDLVSKLRELNAIAEARGLTLARMALLWVLRDPRVTSVLVGASRMSQLEDTLKILDAEPLDQATLLKIEEVLS